MPNSESSFLRQLSEKDSRNWKLTSKRWNPQNIHHRSNTSSCSESHLMQMQMDGVNMYDNSNNGYDYGYGYGYGMVAEKRKRVMVVVDESLHSKHAMLWALTHVANKRDLLTLLHITPNFNNQTVPGSSSSSSSSSSSAAAAPANQLVTSLGNLCKACKPEVEVEALVIQGPKLPTVVSQVKKLEVSVLVLGQKNSSSFFRCMGGMSSTEKFVEQCINTVECLTIGVRKQSKGIGGYLISTRWRKDFWLLA